MVTGRQFHLRAHFPDGFFDSAADGLEQPLIGLLVDKMFEVQKYCSKTNHMWDGFWILMNKKVWKGIPEPLQEIIARNINEEGVRQRAEVEYMNANLEAELKSKGLEFFTVKNEDFRAKLVSAGFYNEWKKRFGDQVWSLLEQSAGAASHRPVPSRTCYDHLGGEIGVAIYAGLRERDALRPRPDGVVELGPSAGEVLKRLGVDVDAVSPGRQRLAFECLDATQHAPHLAGALGDAVATALTRKRWIRRRPNSRVITLTPSGAKGLRAALGVELSPASAAART